MGSREGVGHDCFSASRARHARCNHRAPPRRSLTVTAAFRLRSTWRHAPLTAWGAWLLSRCSMYRRRRLLATDGRRHRRVPRRATRPRGSLPRAPTTPISSSTRQELAADALTDPSARQRRGPAPAPPRRAAVRLTGPAGPPRGGDRHVERRSAVSCDARDGTALYCGPRTDGRASVASALL